MFCLASVSGLLAQKTVNADVNQEGLTLEKYIYKQIRELYPSYSGKLELQYRISSEGRFIPLIINSSNGIPDCESNLSLVLGNISDSIPGNGWENPMESNVKTLNFKFEYQDYLLPCVRELDIYSALKI